MLRVLREKQGGHVAGVARVREKIVGEIGSRGFGEAL